MQAPRALGDRALVALVIVWMCAVALGMTAVWRYKMTPGTASAAPASWPAESNIPRAQGRATLVMIAHPKCPCTRASIAELERLVRESSGAAAVHVLFVRPEGTTESFVETDLVTRARAMRGVEVHVDIGGAEAKRFGASVSGDTLLYDRDGHLRFHGGITGSRGHEGMNPGHERLLAHLTNGTPAKNDAPVFGCDLSGTARREGP